MANKGRRRQANHLSVRSEQPVDRLCATCWQESCKDCALWPTRGALLGDIKMMRQLSLAALALVVSVLGTNARADGIPQHAATRACCEANFAGTYLGVAVGYGQQRGEILNETIGAPTSGVTFKDNDSGVTVGGYAGY